MPVTQLTEKYTEAFDYARVLHAPDVRKGTEIPYFAHVIAVSAIVLEHGGSEDQAIAALLHDAGEDHGGHARVADIRAKFGDAVADIVEACSDDLPADGETKRPWRLRKDAYIARLKDRDEDEAIVLVSAADKLHNARAVASDYRQVGDKLWSRFNASRDDTLWYYNQLSGVITDRLGVASQLASELRATVDALNTAATHLVDPVALRKPAP
ncbi:MAG: HD domain-containing protein [Acidimicrobiales bacterium]